MKSLDKMLKRLIVKTAMPDDCQLKPGETSNHMQALERSNGRYAYHTKEELKRLAACVADLYEKHNANSIDIATLKVKAGIWGLIGAAIPICVSVLAWLLVWLTKNYFITGG